MGFVFESGSNIGVNMRRLFLCLVCLVSIGSVTGCTTIKYNADGVVYKKWFGKQSIKELHIEKKVDGSLKIKLGQQSSSATNLNKLMSDIAKVAAGATGALVIPE